MNKDASGLYSNDRTMDTTFDEAEAVLEAQRGDRAAFGTLVKAYQKKAYMIAYGFVGNREEALDMAQEAFVRAYRAMDRFDTQMPFYPWFYRIVKNTCLNHIKKKKRRGESSLDRMMESGYDVKSKDRGPAQNASMGELREAILSAMDRMSQDHKEIIVLRHLQELSYTEIATCLEIPQGTVMSRLHTARRALRSELGGLI